MKKKFVFSTLWFLSTGKHGQKGNTGRRQGEMGKTSDVLFRKILLITAAYTGRMADVYIGHCEEKKKKKRLSKFPQVLADPSNM